MLENRNGTSYDIIASYSDFLGSTHYFLQSGPEYIIAHDWDVEWKCWARGEYFSSRLTALEAWKTLIADEADNLF